MPGWKLLLSLLCVASLLSLRWPSLNTGSNYALLALLLLLMSLPLHPPLRQGHASEEWLIQQNAQQRQEQKEQDEEEEHTRSNRSTVINGGEEEAQAHSHTQIRTQAYTCTLVIMRFCT